MRVLCLAIFSLCFSSCAHKQEGAATSFQTLEKKPRVALAPLIDESHHRLKWNVSKEITYGIYDTLLQKNHCTLAQLHKTQEVTKKLSKTKDPFSSDIAWIKDSFPDQEFVIFTILLEHSEKPSYPTEKVAISDSPTDLKIVCQVRVFDLREELPKVILQEEIAKTQHIPRQFTCFNFPQVAFGDPLYTFSPMGIFHAELIHEIALHIEDYILLGDTK